MNHRFCRTRSLLQLGGGVLLFGFAQHVAVHADLAAEEQAFADTLTSDLYSDSEVNECTSSLGVSMCFSLIYPSAIGDSLTQMQDVFGYPQDNQQLVWADTSSQIVDTYSGECVQPSFDDASVCDLAAPTVQIANSIWVRENVTLNATYAEIVGSFSHSLNFDDEAAGGTINAWVQNNTNGLIDSIVSDGPLDPALFLIAVNALYLKASWLHQFETGYTSNDNFYTSPSGAIKANSTAHFMHMVEYFPYSDKAIDGYQLLQLGVAGSGNSSGLSMIFVLPFTDGAETVTSVELLGALQQLELTRMAVALPKFKFESEYSDTLMAALQAIGLTAPFTGGLCVQKGSCDDLVSFVIQKTVIDVNEQGFEAAAVTAIGMTEGAPPIEDPTLFMCDHPFQFFIYDQNSDLMLFEGRVGNPGVPEGSVAELKTSHSDSDFWTSNFYVNGVIEVVQNSTGNKDNNTTTTDNNTTTSGNNITASNNNTKPSDNSTSTSNTTRPDANTTTPVQNATEPGKNTTNTTTPHQNASTPHQNTTTPNTSSASRFAAISSPLVAVVGLMFLVFG